MEGVWNVPDLARFLGVFFTDGFLNRFCRHLFLVAELALLAGVLTRQVGRALGIPLLFWHEVRWKQALAGFSVALLTGKVLLIGYLLDRREPGESAWLALVHARGAVPLASELVHYFAGGLFSLAVVFCAAAAVARTARRMCGPAPRLCAVRSRAPEGASTIAGAQTDLPHLPFVGGLAIGLALWALLVPQLLDAVARHMPGAVARALAWLEGGPRARQPVHALAAVFFAGLTASALLALAFHGTRFNTPATALCSLLGLLTAAYGFLSYHALHPALAAGAVAALVSLGGLATHKLRLEALRPLYRPERRARVYPAPGPRPALIDLDRAGARWRSDAPLVVVCASGGGIRAAVWTGAVLCELERRLPRLPYHVKLVTGASGGMVGATYWASTLVPPQTAAATGCCHDLMDGVARSPDAVRAALVEKLGRDCLSPVIKTAVLRDLALTLIPVPAVYEHRGRALELAIRHNLGRPMEQTFADLAAGEVAGWRPSLIFAPVLVEDGRRLLISNLDLERLSVSRGPSLGAPQAPYSRSAYEFARLFPDAWPQFPLSSAVLLSAAFPLITPPLVLPTEPRLRVADAGYYDVYGVDLATGLLDLHADRLVQNAPGVLVIQIRDEVEHRSLVQTRLSTGPLADWPWSATPLVRGLEELATPIAGVVAAGNAAPLFRNDQQLERLARRFPPGFLQTAVFTFDGEASLSWYITAEEARALSRRAVVDRPVLEQVERWWRDHNREIKADPTAGATTGGR